MSDVNPPLCIAQAHHRHGAIRCALDNLQFDGGVRYSNNSECRTHVIYGPCGLGNDSRRQYHIGDPGGVEPPTLSSED